MVYAKGKELWKSCSKRAFPKSPRLFASWLMTALLFPKIASTSSFERRMIAIPITAQRIIPQAFVFVPSSEEKRKLNTRAASTKKRNHAER